jgi:ribosomal protein S27E
MRVAAPSDTFTELELCTGDNGQEYYVEVPYMTVNCARCGNSATVYGHTDASYRAACCDLRATCPKGESNYYAIP